MNKRVEWIDIAKGYGILCVIIGHLPLPFFRALRGEIYTFHMPLFFFLSGCVFSVNKYNFKEFLKRKIKTIVVPYFALGIPMIIFSFILMYNSNGVTLSDYYNLIIRFLIQRKMWTLWFIACLFWLNILFYAVVKLCNNDYKKIGIVTLALTVTGLTYYRLGGIGLPWNIDVCFIAILFFYAGYLFKNISRIHKFILVKGKQGIIMFTLFLIINVVCFGVNYIVFGCNLEMFSNSYGLAPLTFVSAFAGIMCVIIFSNAFNIKVIKYIGCNSLIYYAWHQTIIIPIIYMLYSKLGIFQGTSIMSQIINLFVSVLLICTISTIVDYIIRHSKLKFMVGVYGNKKGILKQRESII